MSIERTNILSLIGGNGRYHSCILTTYSFDFYFFEMKMMRWLRSCGVSNTTVFIDGHFYSELMQNHTGEEMSYSTNYSIIPVFEKGIFHPKIIMLFGEKEGLLIVGSGNLTNAGNGNNDEIWGAYHFDIKKSENENAPLFSCAWKYFSQLSSTVEGINHERTSSWIINNSKWLTELPQVENFQFIELLENESVAFLYNSNESSIWQNIKKNTENDKIVDILIVSPYYDLDGKALTEIKTKYPTAKISVVLDDNGAIPNNLPDDKEYSFYDWKELNICRNIGSKEKSRLHAKILFLKSSNGIEYCLIGSANITSAGLGISKIHNNEVSLFIKSFKNNLLNRIGIKLKSDISKPLSTFKTSEKFDITKAIINKNRFPIKLYSAEVHDSKLTIYSSIGKNSDVVISLYDKNNQLYREETIENFNNNYVLSLEIDDDKLHYIQIQNTDGKNISNKILISNISTIIRTHPNPKNAEFEKFYSQYQSGELNNILDLIYYASIDETEKEDGISIAVGSGKTNNYNKKTTADQSQLYDLSKYEAVDSKTYLKENSILQSPTLRILDAIKFSKINNSVYQAKLRPDEQMGDLSNMDGDEENQPIQEEIRLLKILESDKRKLKQFFSSLYDYYHNEILYKYLELSKYQLNLTDFSKYLVALELIRLFGGKTEKVEYDHEQFYFNYFPTAKDYEIDNVKGCCLNIVGDFLRLARNGFIDYNFEYTRKKFEKLKSDALVNTIVCIINISWNSCEKHYFKTLLLNTLHYLGWNKVLDFDQNIDTLFLKLKERANCLIQKSKDLENQLSYFINQVCPAFRESTQKRENKIFSESAYEGQIIYSSIAGIGYCYVSSVYNKNEYLLARAGFEWDEDEQKFTNYFADGSYSRLILNKMTIIDL